MEFLWLVLILIVTTAVVLLFRGRWSQDRVSPTGAFTGAQTVNPTAHSAVTPRTVPESGVLLPNDVIDRLEGTLTWEALQSAGVPLALEYAPISEAELTRYRSVPVNSTAQKALTDLYKAVGPKQPTVYRAVLPKGGQLVKTAAGDGFRGFARGAKGISSHAVLKPVGVAGAAAAGWPVLAVAATVFALDAMAQREQRAHQRRIESLLARQEARHIRDRLATLRSIDDRLTTAISRLLDGHHPELEVAEQRASEEFHKSAQFLAERWPRLLALKQTKGSNGSITYRALEQALGGGPGDVDDFITELHLARAAIALGRKALLAEAAAAAFADSGNPYTSFRRALEHRAGEITRAEANEKRITTTLMSLELEGRWHERSKVTSRAQEELRRRIAPPKPLDAKPVQYLMLPAGEIRQLVPMDSNDGDPSSSSETPLAVQSNKIRVAGQDAWVHDSDAKGGTFHTYDQLTLDDDPYGWHKLHVWLPPGYSASTSRHPVIFANDGHQVFFGGGIGQNWWIQEIVQESQATGTKEDLPIVVGVEWRERSSEYLHEPIMGLPFGPAEVRQGGGLRLYSNYLAYEVVPFIDANYRTVRDRHHRVIVGASHGGLAAFFTGVSHGEVFGQVVAMSPSFWAGTMKPLRQSKLYQSTVDNLSNVETRPRIYIDWGLQRGGGYHNKKIEAWATSRGEDMHDILVHEHGYVDGVDLMAVADPEGQHDEDSWRRRLPGALRFALRT